MIAITILFLASVIPPVYLAKKIYAMDRIEPEPRGLIRKLVLCGALACLPAVILEYLGEYVFGITFRNMSSFTVERVYFTVQCYDTEGEPMVCNTDGTSTSFDGNYPVTLYPGERTEHGYFNFGKGSYSKPLGKVVLHITGWKDSEGYTRNISSEDDQPTMYWYGDIYRQVPYGEEENG